MTSSFPVNPGGGATACIIVAGGSGMRCGGERPKQFCLLGDQPVLFYAVRHFGQEALVDQLVIVTPASMVDETRELLSVQKLAKPWQVVAGGSRRQDSVLAGVQAAHGAVRVLIHDGARPFPPENLGEALALLDSHTGDALPCGVVFGMPVTDSIKQAEASVIQRTLPREQLWAMQTPQIFPMAAIAEALIKCDADCAEVTDDASAFEHMGWPVKILMGSRANIKITYAEDFAVAEALLASQSKYEEPSMLVRSTDSPIIAEGNACR